MASDPDLRNRVNIPRSTIPAVTHVDYSARVQTVDDGAQPAACDAAAGVLRADRLPGAREHELQRPRRADRLHAGGRVSLLPGAPRWTRSCSRTSILLKEDVAETLDAAAREKYLAQFQLD